MMVPYGAILEKDNVFVLDPVFPLLGSYQLFWSMPNDDLPPNAQPILPFGLSDSCPLPIEKLKSMQHVDPCLDQVLYFG